MRREKNTLVKQQLVEWKDLQKLNTINQAPVIRKSQKGPDFEACAELLQDVYTTSTGIHTRDQYQPIPQCTLEEVSGVIRRMRKRKASDTTGVILEMFLHGGNVIQEQLTRLFNEIITSGSIPAGWRESFFILLHKGGCTQDANNWRPIAILRIAYKMFARILHNRIKGTLEASQSHEQYGFRPGRSTTDPLLIAETLISHSLEYNFDLWLVSIDLRKAFDRVEQDALFCALEEQGLEPGYRYILQQVYKDQIGILNENISFPISRGVRQGDVLSPMLFNAVLEKALSMWKSQLRGCGFYLQDSFQEDPLTNVRFADDLLLFGKSLDEAVHMIELLASIFKGFGLELNTKKTKMMSTSVMSNDTVLVDTSAGLIGRYAVSPRTNIWEDHGRETLQIAD